MLGNESPPGPQAAGCEWKEMPLGARWTWVQMPALLLTHRSALSQPFPSQSLSFLTCIMGTGVCEIGDCEMPLWYLAHGRHCMSVVQEWEEVPAAGKGSPLGFCRQDWTVPSAIYRTLVLHSEKES